MKMNSTMTGETETSGTGFFTWAVLVVVAGLLVAVTTDFTAERNMTTVHATQTSQTASHDAS
ncbi:MAG TPA: hypothetical protein VG889_08990 [Rhizomicrobium sp.]|nr:hypothetical protein [Rhizomicrobium sp.]